MSVASALSQPGPDLVEAGQYIVDTRIRPVEEGIVLTFVVAADRRAVDLHALDLGVYREQLLDERAPVVEQRHREWGYVVGQVDQPALGEESADYDAVLT